ncbi:hypothetical protein CRG98_000441 [Punica granatum]|uniref:Uncharacterized protein n=1 Tax=Punica granatum TaxID=22663 RepID=A0A2I0LEQ2_PUNGR|nr:hypothetical protein CRG98_000441 [Punica granatum]
MSKTDVATCQACGLVAESAQWAGFGSSAHQTFIRPAPRNPIHPNHRVSVITAVIETNEGLDPPSLVVRALGDPDPSTEVTGVLCGCRRPRGHQLAAPPPSPLRFFVMGLK